jgi:hypothetical protein
MVPHLRPQGTRHCVGRAGGWDQGWGRVEEQSSRHGKAARHKCGHAHRHAAAHTRRQCPDSVLCPCLPVQTASCPCCRSPLRRSVPPRGQSLQRPSTSQPRRSKHPVCCKQPESTPQQQAAAPQGQQAALLVCGGLCCSAGKQATVVDAAAHHKPMVLAGKCAGEAVN